MNSIAKSIFFASAIAFALLIIFANSANAVNCSSHAWSQCSGKTLYWYDSCGNQESAEYCPSGCWDNQCHEYNYGCAWHAYQTCVGNYLYWHDSCGNQQDSQYCSNGCYDGQCQNYNYNYNYNYSNCTYHAYKLCAGNSIYWYDSCGNQQDLYQTCVGTNQICQYGQCVYQAPAKPYSAYYKKACYGNNVYWYNSLGAVTALYKSCLDANSCTVDTCSAGACSNQLKCDGSTCSASSADYEKYCAPAVPDTPETDLSVSFFSSWNMSDDGWKESTEIFQNGRVYFLVVVTNNGTDKVDDIIVSADIPSEIVSLGNVKIDAVPVSRDIVSGVNVGSLEPSDVKTINFEGKTQAFTTEGTKQAVIFATASDKTEKDFIDISFSPDQSASASVSGAATNDIWEFVKRWYLWILIGVVLVFLFIVVFRRLSTNA